MERYLGYIINVASMSDGQPAQPVYADQRASEIARARIVDSLPATAAWGRSASATRPTAGRRTTYTAPRSSPPPMRSSTGASRPWATRDSSGAWSTWASRPPELYASPDAGLWELRGSTHVHTFSSVMCWVACDRLAKIARRLGITEPAQRWRAEADRIHAAICERAWSSRRASFVSTFDGEDLDASLLLLAEFGFLKADDPRFASTVGAVERDVDGAATSSSATSSPTISASPTTRSWSARSGTSMRWRRSAGARRRVSCSSHALAQAKPAGTAVRGHRPRHRRTLGKFPADLQHGGPHQQRHAAERLLGRRLLRTNPVTRRSCRDARPAVLPPFASPGRKRRRQGHASSTPIPRRRRAGTSRPSLPRVRAMRGPVPRDRARGPCRGSRRHGPYSRACFP